MKCFAHFISRRPSTRSGATRRRPKRRIGMTLVELVTAIALAAMLMAAMTGVLRGIALQTRAAQTKTSPLWPSRFQSILRRDVLSADAIWMNDGHIHLRCDAPLYQAKTGRRSQREVVYHCKKLDTSTHVLYRSDGNGNAAIAIGPKRIQVERLDSQGNPQPLPPTPGPVPAALRVWVWQEEESPLFVHDMVVR